ncbi:MAG: hypothetical protein JWO65_1883 [Sphingomonas bacterium]|nr:hypothetical protein [Sphingomonas bacterium]
MPAAFETRPCNFGHHCISQRKRAYAPHVGGLGSPDDRCVKGRPEGMAEAILLMTLPNRHPLSRGLSPTRRRLRVPSLTHAASAVHI